ncbi:MAG: GDSL family lipase [Clostridia bacterium]|nr:GDSL family lipase [Clostridia bacterium]
MSILTKIKEKQANIFNVSPITVVFLGDSVTQGCFELYKTSPTTLNTVFDYNNAFSTKFKKILNLLYPSVQINVINSGISGDNATGGLARMERDVLKYSPDLVVVGFALNDSTKGLDKIEEYKSSMKKIISKVKELDAECILLTPNMMNTYVSYRITDEKIMTIAEKCMIIQNEGVLDKYVEELRTIGKESDVKVCDVYAKWKNMSKAGIDTTELLSNYVNHPIRELHTLTATMLIDTIFEE